jgi:hypothetical protein
MSGSVPSGPKPIPFNLEAGGEVCDDEVKGRTKNEPTMCQWCETPFRPRRGGSPQRFCGPKCRMAFWSALRQWGERAIAAGTITIADVKNGVATACTLLTIGEPILRLRDIGSGVPASPDRPLQFYVEVERGLVAGLVRLGLIRSNELNDLGTVISALRRIGQTPSIWCVG